MYIYDLTPQAAVEAGGYKTKTEDLRPKNEDPVKIVLKSLEKGWNMILERSRNKEQHNLRLLTNLTRVFVLYKTLPTYDFWVLGLRTAFCTHSFGCGRGFRVS